MKIIVDKEGREAIQKLIDAALRKDGVAAFNFTQYVLSSIKDEELVAKDIETKTGKGK